jgi:exosortase A
MLTLLAVSYRSTYASIVAKWFGDVTYSHGMLVVPIVVGLAWRKRAELAQVVLAPSWAGVVALAGASVVWLVARGAGVLVVEQLAATAMVSAVVMCVLGTAAARVLAFPLAFLFFAVPFGRGLVPWLMQFTADVSVTALKWTGIPVYRSDMILSIPGGDFEVARACSGLNYLITGVVLGTLYAYLTYSSLRKRLIFIAAAVVVPILANGLRAYLVIAIAHWSDMRWGTGQDHVIFGRVLFLLVMGVMFWVGTKWRDSAVPARAMATQENRTTDAIGSAVVALIACAALLPAVPTYLAVTAARADDAIEVISAHPLTFPELSGTWRGPLSDRAGWRPLFEDAVAEGSAVYLSSAGEMVEAYVGVYGIGGSSRGELISYRNRIYAGEHRSLLREEDVPVEFADGLLRVRQLLVPAGTDRRLVWYWFVVGDRPAATRTGAKLLEAVGFVTGGATVSRIVTLATRADEPGAAQQRLMAFVRANSPCVRSGFAPGVCGS